MTNEITIICEKSGYSYHCYDDNSATQLMIMLYNNDILYKVYIDNEPVSYFGITSDKQIEELFNFGCIEHDQFGDLVMTERFSKAGKIE